MKKNLDKIMILPENNGDMTFCPPLVYPAKGPKDPSKFKAFYYEKENTLKMK